MLTTALAVLIGAAAASAAVPNSPGPLLWTAPGGVSNAPIDSISCPSTTLCVAADRSGGVVWSTNPAGGPRAWHGANIDRSAEITSVSCPSTTECVAVDGSGDVVSTTDPTGGSGAWSVAKVDTSPTSTNTDNGGAVLMRGVSCPSTTLCVAVDAAGNAAISSNPTGGSGAWGGTHIDVNRSYGCSGNGLACQPPVVGVSCPSVSQCVAVDFAGNILTTQTPTQAGPWSSVSATRGGLGSLWGVTCPTTAFCASVNGTGSQSVTFNPADPGAFTTHTLPDPAYNVWCRSAGLCLSPVSARGGLSGVLGSYNPLARKPVWALSPLGAVNTVACPTPSVCVAGDDQGDIVAGVTTHAVTSLLLDQLLPNRRLPTIPALVRAHGQRLTVTSPIAATVTLTWTVPGLRLGSAPVTLASVTHTFRTPGKAALTLPLNLTGLRVMRFAKKSVTVTATSTFAASTGSLRVVRKRTYIRPAPKKGKKPVKKK